MRLVAAAGLLVCLCSTAFAQTDLPPAALAAESEGQWEVALRLYHDLLAQQPTRADLWVRVADIEARLGNADAAIAALRSAAGADRENPELHVRLSQAYAAADSPEQALQSINQALALRPTDPEYLHAGAVLATWTGDYATARERYLQLRALEPADETVLLDLAHVSAWAGQTTQAINAYRQYLEREPDAPEAWLELATAETWRGNYTGALDALEEHRSRQGASRAHALGLARAYAGAGRPSRAVDALEPLWQLDPTDYEVNLARTSAFTMQRSIGKAYEALAAVRAAQPDSAETKNAERAVRATLGSSIGPAVSFYADSDDLQVVTVAPSGTLRLRSGTDISAGYVRSEFRAPREGGLGTALGRPSILQEVWGGLAQTAGGVTVSGRVGSARAEGQDLTTYAVGARWRVSDAFDIGVERRYGFVAISPRTVELGLTEHRNGIAASWTPTLRVTIDAEATYSELSDGNRRWEARVSPRSAVVRSEWLNLDLGASAYRLEATRDLSNGYYDPRGYEAYQGTAFPYFKFSEDIGLGVSVALGVQREQGLPFGFGGSATAEATFGIYRAWLLRVGASATHNVRQQSGAFGGYGGSALLVRRF
jgi:Flp pilus assembly protein TadD